MIFMKRDLSSARLVANPQRALLEGAGEINRYQSVSGAIRPITAQLGTRQSVKKIRLVGCGMGKKWRQRLGANFLGADRLVPNIGFPAQRLARTGFVERVLSSILDGGFQEFVVGG